MDRRIAPVLVTAFMALSFVHLSASQAPLQDVQEAALQHAPLSDPPPAKHPADPFVIETPAGVYEPAGNISPVLPRSGMTYGYIMTDAVLTPEQKQTLEGYGAAVFSYQTFRSYAARIPAGAAQAIAALPFVRWVGDIPPALKILPAVRNAVAEDPSAARGVFVGLFEQDTIGGQPIQETYYYPRQPDAPVGGWGHLLQQQGMTLAGYDHLLHGYFGQANRAAVESLVQLDIVEGIDLLEGDLAAMLDESAPAIAADYVRNTYSGSGVWAGLIDNGYNKNHADLPTPSYCNDVAGTGCYTDPTGHGTFVAGIFWGRGAADKKYKGVAPGISNIKFATAKTGADLDVALGWMGQSPVPSVVSLSLGQPLTGPCTGLETLSKKVDTVSYSTGQTYVIAAGNCGPAGSPSDCGSITPGPSKTIVVPACAKNAISVGDIVDWGINTADSISLSSSRGPANDCSIISGCSNRMEPAIVAPGTPITSTSASNNTGYFTASGASAAAPHAAGLIAALMDHYPNLKGNPAAVKALLAAGALPYQGDASTIGNTYGHGKIDSYLSHWVYDTSDGWKWGWASGQFTSTASVYQYLDISVPSGTDRLTVALAWTEPQAGILSSFAVINDIDLYIDKGADQSGCAGEWSSASYHDNKEWVWINNPGSGTFRLKICPYSLDGSTIPQKFAIAYYIIRGDPAPVPSFSLSGPATVEVGKPFTIAGTVTAPAYVVSSPVAVLYHGSAPGITLNKFETTREDGTLMTYAFPFNPPSAQTYNLGDTRVQDSRAISWTLTATSDGQKTIKTSVYSSNGGGTQDKFITINALKSAGSSCSGGSQCFSGYCEGSASNSAKCCSSQPPSDGWSGGGDIGGCSNFNDPSSQFLDYYCDSAGNAQSQSTNTFSCNSQDGWYNSGDSGPGCLQKDDPTAQQRDYYVIPNSNSCAYGTCQSLDCDAQDGWYGGGNTQTATCGFADADAASQERDYYATSSGTCTSTTQNCGTKSCNSQDGWKGGGNSPGCGTDPPSVWTDFYTQTNTNTCSSTTTCTGSGAFSCDGQDQCGQGFCTGTVVTYGTDYYVVPDTNTCASQPGSSEDCALKPSADTDGNNPLIAGTCTDYTGCSSGACAFSSLADACTTGTSLTEYFASGTSCGSQAYGCSGFEIAALDSDSGDNPAVNGACTGGKGASCSSGAFSTTNGISGTDACEGTCGAGPNSCQYREWYAADSSDACGGLDTCTSKTYDADTNSNTCSTCKGAGFWNLGGIANCCGDDSGEFKSKRVCEPGVCTSDPADGACCNLQTDCVYGGVCYANGFFGDVDGDPQTEQCNKGTWAELQCAVPQSGFLTENTVFCSGTYPLQGPLWIGADGITVVCNETVLRASADVPIVLLNGYSNVSIENCQFENASKAISVNYGSDNVFSGNAFRGNTVGISLSQKATNNRIINNSFASLGAAQGFYGIGIFDSDGNTISGNTVSEQTWTGIFSYNSPGTMIVSNNISQNPSSGVIIDAGQGTVVANNTIERNADGIQLRGATTNTIISENMVNANRLAGIRLLNASNNSIEKNVLAFTDNNFPPFGTGLILQDGGGNTVSKNIIISNRAAGVAIANSFGNVISDNLLENNTINAKSSASTNFWNITKTPGQNIIGGEFQGGNFWDDYTGWDTDGDGIGDTNLPYTSNGNIMSGGDFLPLTANVNLPPAFLPMADPSVNESQQLSLKLNATDPDTPALIFGTNAGSVLPGNPTFDSQLGTLLWTPTFQDAGTYPVLFTVTDGVSLANVTLTIAVLNVNTPPVLDPISDIAVMENQTAVVVVTASDPQNDTLTFSINSSLFSQNGNTFSWKTGFADAGKQAVLVNVSDGEFTDSQVVLVTVTELYNQTSVALHAGWNLVSLPLKPWNAGMPAPVAGFTGSYDIIYAYNASETVPWKQYSPQLPPFLNTLKTLDQLSGFAMNVTAPGTLTALGFSNPASSWELKQGWNFIGFPSEAAVPAAAAFKNVNSSLLLAVTFGQNGNWISAGPQGAGTLTELQPGAGLWVKLSKDAAWTFAKGQYGTS